MIGTVVWNYALLAYFALGANKTEVSLDVVESKTPPTSGLSN